MIIIRAITSVSFFCGHLLFTPSAKAQGDEQFDRLTLKGIPAFHASASVSGLGAPSGSSIESSLQTQVELCLRREGIGVLDSATIGPSVVFDATVIAAENKGGIKLGYATMWRFEVRQLVRTTRGAVDFVATWATRMLDITPNDMLENNLTRDVDQGCAKFSNAWLSVNPKSR